VIDSLPIHHSRPVGIAKSVNGFVEGRDYRTDIDAILERFGLSWEPAVTFGGLRPNGTYTSNRLELVAGAMALIAAVPIRSARFRASAVAKYFKHLLSDGARMPGRSAASNCTATEHTKEA